MLRACSLTALLGVSIAMSACSQPANHRAQEVRDRAGEKLSQQVVEKGFTPGSHVYLRVFKEEEILECWMKKGARYELFKAWPICRYSGNIGPKLKEGDGQAPEGCYEVGPAAMNPESRYHLSFNLGFPNAYDQALGRTGSFLMVHGDCVSIGCYAMTDPVIEEIYLLMEDAFAAGQKKIQVDCFPFRLNEQALKKHEDSPWHAFWVNLAEGYQIFETHRLPPRATLKNNRYVFESEAPDRDS